MHDVKWHLCFSRVLTSCLYPSYLQLTVLMTMQQTT